MNITTAENTTPAAISAGEPKIPQTISYYFAFIGLGLTEAILGPSLPALARHTGSTLSQVSILFTAHSFGYMLGSYLSGRLFDRLRGQPLIAAGLLGVGLMIALAPLIPLLWLLALALFLSGAFAGTIDVGCNTLLIWVHRNQVGPFMNGLHFFFGVGSFLTPILLAQSVLLSGNIHWAYWFIAALTIPMAVVLLRISSPLASEAHQDGPANNLDIRRVAIIMLFFFLSVGVESSFSGWIYTYTTTMKLDSLSSAAYLNSFFWGALTIGRLLSIPLATRFRPRTLLIADVTGALFSLSLILLFPLSQIALWAGTFGIGFSMASQFPTTLSLAGTQMNITGRVTGIFLIGCSLGGMFVPWLIGQFFVPVGPRSAMFILLVGMLGMSLALAGWLVDSKRRLLAGQ